MSKKSFSILCLLFVSGWISVSVSQSQTVDVQSGGDVTLHCSKMFNYDPLTFWLRLVNKTKVSCISVLTGHRTMAKYCDGYENGKFEMSSNISTVFLKIRQVDFSDSGLYFCGFYTSGRLIVSLVSSHQMEKTSDEKPELTSLILGGLTVFLVMVIIGLVVKIRKLQKEKDPQRREVNPNLDSGDLNYATVDFGPAARRRRELEPNVVYAATR
uniref:Immunoglobulin domain-containing protein n=1 Tax=Seriola lalandi dorsalis TaxID=1841481 RepID=A0A3B4XZ50_SERLL